MTRLPVTPRPRGPASPALVRDLRPRPPGPGPEGSPFPQASPRAPLPRGLPMRDSRPAYAPDSPGLPVLAPVPCTPSGHRPPAPPRGSPGPPVRPPSPDKPPGALAVPTPPPPGRPTATDVLRPLGQHGPPMRDPRPRNAPGQSPRASPPRPLLRRSPGKPGAPPYGPRPRGGLPRTAPPQVAPERYAASPGPPRSARGPPLPGAPPSSGPRSSPGLPRSPASTAQRGGPPCPPVPGSGLPPDSPAPVTAPGGSPSSRCRACRSPALPCRGVAPGRSPVPPFSPLACILPSAAGTPHCRIPAEFSRVCVPGGVKEPSGRRQNRIEKRRGYG